jgi:hypothetical protein
MAAPTLGALTLPDQIIWADRYSYTPITGQNNRTLAGGFAIFNQLATKGRPITLDARDGVAWLTQSQVDSLMTMAAAVGATYVFTYDGESHNVQFAHASPPVVDFTSIWPHAVMYTGIINLITI